MDGKGRDHHTMMDMNMINSPKSSASQYYNPDIQKELNLESLSNDDLSRVDATSAL